MTRVLHDLTREGHAVDEEAVVALSPYQTEHINRFGRYHTDDESDGVSVPPMTPVPYSERRAQGTTRTLPFSGRRMLRRASPATNR
jgi:hypothetical protein